VKDEQDQGHEYQLEEAALSSPMGSRVQLAVPVLPLEAQILPVVEAEEPQRA
jgi:hypothetical protein